MKLIYIFLLTALLGCNSQKSDNSTTENNPSNLNEQSENPEFIKEFTSIDVLGEDYPLKKIKTIDSVLVSEKGSSISILFQQFQNWNDPGEYLRCLIKNSKNEILLDISSIDGFVKFKSMEVLKSSLFKENEVNSDFAYVRTNKNGKQLFLFGYPYASDPSGLTIIDLFPKPKVVFNYLYGVSEIEYENGFIQLKGETLNQTEATLDTETMTIK